MIKVADLEFENLDYWAARAHGMQIVDIAASEETHGRSWGIRNGESIVPYFPSTNAADGCPLLDLEQITTIFGNGAWMAGKNFRADEDGQWSMDFMNNGPGQLIAGLRSLVESVFGAEVQSRT